MAEKKKELYLEAQRRLIASMLADSEKSDRIFEIVTVEDFEEPRFQIIFEAMVTVARVDQEINAITVSGELESKGLLQKTGGISELYSMKTKGENWLLEAPAELYAHILKELSAKSKMKALLKENSELLAEDSGVTAAETIGVLQSSFNTALFSLSDDSTVSQLENSMDSYLELLDERKKRAEENAADANGLQGIPSLLPSINKYTTGWLPGQMITVGARTGVGKSVFAVNSAMAAAKAGKSVLFFSLEMGEAEIKDRMVASTTGIPLNSLKQGSLSDEERRIFMESKDRIDSMKLQIDVDPKVTIDTIRARCLRRAQSQDGLDFVIVDYLQLITPTGRFSSRQEAIADVSRNTKLLAKQLGVPIMVLVQVNRESNAEESSLPRLDQIRESGAIAQDSDIVILIHRDQSLDDAIPHTLILLEKNRNGEANKTIRCHSNLECSLFREVQKAKDVDENMTDDAIDQLNNYSSDPDLEDFDDLALDLDDDF